MIGYAMATVHERTTGGVGAESAFERIGATAARYGLVVVIAGIGICKFFSFEAQSIQPLVANSPLMSWLYDVLSVDTFAALLGVVELVTAALLAVKPWWPRLSIAGSVMAVGIFLGTISFLISTPGVFEASAGGFPILSSTGQFLIKDVALLGISLWTLGDAMKRREVGPI
jgi:uncharacterized membrane protein YkgB